MDFRLFSFMNFGVKNSPFLERIAEQISRVFVPESLMTAIAEGIGGVETPAIVSFKVCIILVKGFFFLVYVFVFVFVFHGNDTDTFVGSISFTSGEDSFIFLESHMNDSSLIRIHGF